MAGCLRTHHGYGNGNHRPGKQRHHLVKNPSVKPSVTSGYWHKNPEAPRLTGTVPSWEAENKVQQDSELLIRECPQELMLSSPLLGYEGSGRSSLSAHLDH